MEPMIVKSNTNVYDIENINAIYDCWVKHQCVFFLVAKIDQ